MDLEPDSLHLRTQLSRTGFSSNEIDRLLHSGDLTRVRPGAYLTGPMPSGQNRHEIEIVAACEQLSDAAVVSHVSAAVLHGLPTWRIHLGKVHVTRGRNRGGRVGDLVHVHVGPLAADEIAIVKGLPVTSPARTVVDLARTASFEKAVIAADAALREGLVDRPALDEALHRAKGWPGTPRARRVVDFADGRSESVGESRSRVAIFRVGLPDPTPQWEVRNHRGVLLARTDFGWKEQRTVGEFDGMVKYGRLLQPGQDAGDVVVAEKVREDAIRDQDLRVVRWIWDDLDDFRPTAERLRRAMAT